MAVVLLQRQTALELVSHPRQPRFKVAKSIYIIYYIHDKKLQSLKNISTGISTINKIAAGGSYVFYLTSEAGFCMLMVEIYYTRHYFTYTNMVLGAGAPFHGKWFTYPL